MLHYTIHIILYCATLYYTIPHNPILYNTDLYYTMLHYTTLYCTILYYAILTYIILHYTTLHFTTVQFTTAHYAKLHCSVISFKFSHDNTEETLNNQHKKRAPFYPTLLYYTVLILVTHHSGYLSVLSYPILS